MEEVTGYLNQWTDALIVRHKSIEVLEEIEKYADFPVINAMTDRNHPCEMLADMYVLSKIRSNFTEENFLFVGADGNIGRAWKEASELMGFSLTQCSPLEYAIDGVKHVANLQEAIQGKDIVCTDSISREKLEAFQNYRITEEVMQMANPGALLNPCPPFFRGEEVSDEVINSEYFVGYSFKKYLLEIQQAILIYCLTR